MAKLLTIKNTQVTQMLKLTLTYFLQTMVIVMSGSESDSGPDTGLEPAAVVDEVHIDGDEGHLIIEPRDYGNLKAGSGIHTAEDITALIEDRIEEQKRNNVNGSHDEIIELLENLRSSLEVDD